MANLQFKQYKSYLCIRKSLRYENKLRYFRRSTQPYVHSGGSQIEAQFTANCLGGDKCRCGNYTCFQGFCLVEDVPHL